jgi:hypothetical protein
LKALNPVLVELNKDSHIYSLKRKLVEAGIPVDFEILDTNSKNEIVFQNLFIGQNAALVFHNFR